MTTPVPDAPPRAHIERVIAALWQHATRLLAPSLASIRTGRGLRDSLVALLEDLVGNPGSAVSMSSTPVPTTGRRDDIGPLDPADVPPTVAALHDALGEGVRRATAAGEVWPDQPVDKVAWAITSLLMTLSMRAQEGDRTEDLLQVGIAALEDLLGE